jgi:hypothetical protein
MAARAIQQELIDEFASKPELSDWFSRVRPSFSRNLPTSADKCTGRNCPTTQSEETQSAKREEQGHSAGTRRRGEKVRGKLHYTYTQDKC